VGNSYYHGLTFEVRNRFRQSKNGAAFSFRAVYTLSFLKDDGVVNTSDALVAGGFSARGFVWITGSPASLRILRHARYAKIPGAITNLAGSAHCFAAPFNIGLGADRNLDDINNDRPGFTGDARVLKWRNPGQPIDASISTNSRCRRLARQATCRAMAAEGPGQFIFDLSVTASSK